MGCGIKETDHVTACLCENAEEEEEEEEENADSISDIIICTSELVGALSPVNPKGL